MATLRRIACSALLLVSASLWFSADAKTAPVPTPANPGYSRGELDAKLTLLRAELNKSLDQLRALIGAAASRSDVDAKLDLLRQLITQTDKAASDRAQALSQALTEAGNRIPTTPWWVSAGLSPLVSLLIAVSTIFVSWRIAADNRKHSDDQREKDLAEAAALRTEDLRRAEEQRQADEKRMRDEIRRNLAWSSLNQWQAGFDKIARALGTLKYADDWMRLPEQARNEKFNEVIAIGNMYEQIGQVWRSGDADDKIMNDAKIKMQAKTFLDAVEQARERLAAGAVQNGFDLQAYDERVRSWEHLRWLAA